MKKLWEVGLGICIFGAFCGLVVTMNGEGISTRGIFIFLIGMVFMMVGEKPKR